MIKVQDATPTAVLKVYRFMDRHSGGDQKTDYAYIYIDAYSEREAVEIFETETGRDPYDITCSCCGQYFNISEEVNIQQATGFDRHCLYTEEHGYVESASVHYDRFTPLSDYLEQPDVLYVRKPNT